MNTVRKEILQIIQEKTDTDIEMEGDISLIDDLGFDSLQLVEVLTEIEERFRVSFEDGEKLLDFVDHLEMMISYVEEINLKSI